MPAAMKKKPAHVVEDLLHEHADAAAGKVAVVLGVVDEVFQLGLSDLLCAEAKDEEHGINDVGLAASVRANNRGEALSIDKKSQAQ